MFCSVSCWQGVKIHEGLLKLPGFQCIGGQQCAAPNKLPDAGPGGCAKRCIARPWQRRACIFLSCFWFAVCGKMRCMDTIAMAMQCNASPHGRDAGPGDTP